MASNKRSKKSTKKTEAPKRTRKTAAPPTPPKRRRASRADTDEGTTSGRRSDEAPQQMSISEFVPPELPEDALLQTAAQLSTEVWIRGLKAMSPDERQAFFAKLNAQKFAVGDIDNVTYYGGTAAAEYIESLGLHVDGYLTMVILYLFRLGKKPGQSIEKDLRKAEWYLHRLAKIEGSKMLDSKIFIDCCNALEDLMKIHGVETKSTETDYAPEPDENGDAA